MKKLKLFFAALALLVGTAAGWAQKDVTATYITNATLSDGTNGWTVNNFNAPVRGNNTVGYASEAYAGWGSLEKTSYSLTQTITLPAGHYTLVNYSFFRQGETANTNVSKSLAFLKAGTQQVALKTLGSITAKSYANSQAEGANAFDSKMYRNTLDFTIAADDTNIEIGIVGTFDESKSWCIAGMFELIDNDTKATKNSPFDVTGYITNSGFEYNDMTGWTLSESGALGTQNNKQSFKVGGYYAEKWQPTADGALTARSMTQTLTGLPDGYYKLSANLGGDGTYIKLNDEIANHTEDKDYTVECEIGVGDDLTITAGKTAEGTANWIHFDNFKLYYLGDIVQLYNEALAESQAYKAENHSMFATYKTALDNAITTYGTIDTSNKTLVKEAISALTLALDSAKLSAGSFAIVGNNTICENMDGWTASNLSDGATFRINTWSHEGATDGSGVDTPFIEHWRASGNNLGNKELTYKLPAAEAGIYKVTALIRTLNEAGGANPSGVKMFVGEDGTVSATNGQACVNGTYGTYTAVGKLSVSGDFKFGFEIASANVNWISIKSFKIEYIGADESSIVNDLTAPTGSMNATQQAALAAAQTAFANTVATYNTLSETIMGSYTSVAAYAKLKQAIDEAAATAATMTSATGTTAYNTAIAAVQQKYDDGTVADADILTPIKEVGDALAELAKTQTDNNSDMTLAIKNHSFEYGDLYGWTTNTTGDTGIKSNSNGAYHIDNADGDYLFNTWNSDAVGYDITQRLANVHKGVYKLEVLLAGLVGGKVDVFANGEKTTVTLAATGSGQEASLEFNLLADSAITIGIKNATSWYKADNFRLTYLRPVVLATAEDFAALDAAVASVESKRLGFEKGENEEFAEPIYAPYLHANIIKSAVEAKKIDKTINHLKSEITALTTAVSAPWTKNTEVVNAIAGDGGFNSYTTIDGKDYPNGWTDLTSGGNDSRICGINEFADKPGLEGVKDKHALLVKYEATYGTETGYTLPLEADTVYQFTFKYGVWGSGNIKKGLSVIDPDGKVIDMTPAIINKNSDTDGNAETSADAWYDCSAKFKTTKAGNYILKITNPEAGEQRQMAFGNMSLYRFAITQANYDALVEEGAYIEGEMNADVQAELDAAIEQNINAGTDSEKRVTAYYRLMDAIAAAQKSIEAYKEAKEAIEEMKELADNTNFYTEEAGEAFQEELAKDTVAYNNGTLTDAEAQAINKDYAATVALLKSAWTSEVKVVTEDADDMVAPFVELAVADSMAQTFSAAIKAAPGKYQLTALVDVVEKAAAPAAARAAAAAAKATLQLNDGTAQALADGTVTVKGDVALDGQLRLTVATLAENGLEAIRLKNLKVTKLADADIEDLMTITPAAGKVEALKDFVVYFNGEQVSINETSIPALTNDEGTLNVGGTIALNAAKDSVTLSFPEEIDAIGNYTLYIPENAISYKGTALQDTAFSYTIEAVDVNGLMTVTPAPGEVKSLKDIKLSFTQAVTLNEAAAAKLAPATVTLADDAKSVTIELAEEITAAGEYEVTIPDSLVNIRASYLTDTVLVYTIAEVPSEDLADGKYYLQNVASGKWWGAYNSWGTQASLVEHPEYVTLARLEDGKYTMESQVSNGGTAYYFNGSFMDNASPVSLTFTLLENGNYTIANGETYYGYNGTNNVIDEAGVAAGTDATEWRVLNEEGMMKELEKATATEPVDATFLILDPNFGRNNRNVGAWTVSDDCTNKTLTGGNSNKAGAESYHSVFTISQKVGLPKGVYAFSAQGFYRQDGSDNENLPVFFAGDETAEFPLKTGSENNMADAATAFDNGLYAIDPIVFQTNGDSILIGTRLENNTSLWCIWGKFGLQYYGDVDIDVVKNAALLQQLADLRKKAEELKDDVDVEVVKDALDAALAASENTPDVAAINAAIDALTAAISRAEGSVAAKNVLPKMKQLTESTNVYTQEAYNEYYGQWLAKYEDGTITKTEALQLQDPYVVTGWRASVTADNFLLSAWDTNPDFVDAAYYINTWSVEGNNDDSEFFVPFFEYWTGDAESLAERTLTATMTGQENGEYEVSAQVRVRIMNDGGAEAQGIKLQANDGNAVSVTTGRNVTNNNGTASQFYVGNFTATGSVSDGTLLIKFLVAADNNISWLSFQNVKFQKTSSSVGIDDVNRQALEGGNIYNLQGQKVDGTKKGLYIINGRKVVMK